MGAGSDAGSIALVYAFLSAGATILGGLLPIYTRVRNIEMRYMLAFASGLMISVAFFDMLPEAEIAANYLFIGIGFFSLYVVEKLIIIHTCGEEECEVHSIGWVSVIGIAFESIIDGLAIAAGYSVQPVLGAVITLGVISHEIPRGFSTTIIMRNSNYSTRNTFIALFIDAFFTPLGVLLAFVFPIKSFAAILALTAGTFLYIGASDLLPEAHKRFNIKVVLAVLLGVAVVLLLK